MDEKGIIIHLEDRQHELEEHSRLFQQQFNELEYKCCNDIPSFFLTIEENKNNLKALIFDLISAKETKEELEGSPEFLKIIDENFAKYNLPIFIYSGRIDLVENKFSNNGTVYKISKDYSIQVIFDKIALFMKSGFIDVFCPGGILETEIKAELNKSFTNQFSQNSQIEEVLLSIINSNTDSDPKERVKKVFKRIAIKTLSSDLLAPVADSEDKVHPIEHFYKRQSRLPVWTGDVWKEKTNENTVLVLTPRCDLATGKATNIMVARIDILPKPINLNGKPEEVEKRMRDYLTDNLPGKSTRYIPSTVFFAEGGMVNLANHFTIDSNSFTKTFEYRITLSDELTNEIIGKFAYYFLRTGITNINELEFEAIIKSIKPHEE